MKGLLLCLIIGLSSFCVNAETIEVIEAHLNKQLVANKLSEVLIHRIFEKRQEQLGIIPEKDVRFPLLPPVISIPFFDYRLDFEAIPNLLIDGFYEHFDSALVFDTVRDDLVINNLTDTFLDLGYTIGMDKLALRGNYSTNFRLNFTYLNEIIPDFPIDVPDEGLIVPIAGKGGYEISLNTLDLSLELAIEVIESTVISISSSVHSLSLSHIGISFDNFIMFNEFEADWLLVLITVILNQALPDLLALLPPLLELGLDGILNSLLEGCVLTDLIDGDTTCLGLPTDPTESPGPSTAKPTPPYIEDSSSSLASSGVLLFGAIAALFYGRR